MQNLMMISGFQKSHKKPALRKFWLSPHIARASPGHRLWVCGQGAVIKYGTEEGGRDLTVPAKLLDEKCWASKVFQVISLGHEGICF